MSETSPNPMPPAGWPELRDASLLLIDSHPTLALSLLALGERVLLWGVPDDPAKGEPVGILNAEATPPAPAGIRVGSWEEPRLLGLPVRVNPDMPADRIEFRDSNGILKATMRFPERP